MVTVRTPNDEDEEERVSEALRRGHGVRADGGKAADLVDVVLGLLARRARRCVLRDDGLDLGNFLEEVIRLLEEGLKRRVLQAVGARVEVVGEPVDRDAWAVVGGIEHEVVPIPLAVA